MPRHLHEDFLELDTVREEYMNGEHNSKTRLRAAQWKFDIAKKSAKHEDKKENRMAEKHPHLPVVAATTQSGDKLSTSIEILRDAIEDGNKQMQEQQDSGFLALINEVRELRRVSPHRDRWRICG
jgi:hypothetical protein